MRSHDRRAVSLTLTAALPPTTTSSLSVVPSDSLHSSPLLLECLPIPAEMAWHAPEQTAGSRTRQVTSKGAMHSEREAASRDCE